MPPTGNNVQNEQDHCTEDYQSFMDFSNGDLEAFLSNSQNQGVGRENSLEEFLDEITAPLNIKLDKLENRESLQLTSGEKQRAINQSGREQYNQKNKQCYQQQQSLNKKQLQNENLSLFRHQNCGSSINAHLSQCPQLTEEYQQQEQQACQNQQHLDQSDGINQTQNFEWTEQSNLCQNLLNRNSSGNLSELHFSCSSQSLPQSSMSRNTNDNYQCTIPFSMFPSRTSSPVYPFPEKPLPLSSNWQLPLVPNPNPNPNPTPACPTAVEPQPLPGKQQKNPLAVPTQDSFAHPVVGVGVGVGQRKQQKKSDGRKTQTHSQIEKQRRDRINFLIDELREIIPTKEPNLENFNFAGAINLRPKHVVLNDTIDWIRTLQQKLLQMKRIIQSTKFRPNGVEVQGKGVGEPNDASMFRGQEVNNQKYGCKFHQMAKGFMLPISQNRDIFGDNSNFQCENSNKQFKRSLSQCSSTQEIYQKINSQNIPLLQNGSSSNNMGSNNFQNIGLNNPSNYFGLGNIGNYENNHFNVQFSSGKKAFSGNEQNFGVFVQRIERNPCSLLVQVICNDRPGLLFDIIRIFCSLFVEIKRANICTDCESSTVNNVFEIFGVGSDDVSRDYVQQCVFRSVFGEKDDDFRDSKRQRIV